MTDLKFLDIENDSQWDALVLSLDNYSFLLGSFRYKYSNEIDERSFRFAIYEGDVFQGVMCGSFGKTKLFGKYLEFKHSPMLQNVRVLHKRMDALCSESHLCIQTTGYWRACTGS